MSEYETQISGSRAESSAFAEAEIQIGYHGWLKLLRSLVSFQKSYSSVPTKPRIYEEELTDWQAILLQKLPSDVMFRTQVKYLVIFYTSPKRSSFSLASSIRPTFSQEKGRKFYNVIIYLVKIYL